MEPLTPNTSALLEYLSANMTAQQNGDASFDSTFMDPSFAVGAAAKGDLPTSLPPSAFFNMPVPGRDTPEDTPESSASVGASASPEEARERSTGVIAKAEPDADAGGVSRRKSVGGAGAQNKRKAGHAHTVEQESESEEDSDSDQPAGHEGKRQHPNDKLDHTPGRRGGRKSSGADGEGPKPNKENKAARRKEQNRAAQKAFRERREAKVKDLEDKIDDLEAKSTGMSVENDNLRAILKRLQDENVRLKQTAFTFTMPAGANASGTSTPVASKVRPSSSSASPQDDVLRSIHDSPQNDASPALKPIANGHQAQRAQQGQTRPAPPQQQRSGSSALGASPLSLASSSSASVSGAGAHPAFDSSEMFNAFATGTRPEWLKPRTGSNAGPSDTQSRKSSMSTQPTPASQANSSPSVPVLQNGGVSDVEALWASFYPGGINAPKTAQGNGIQSNAFAQPAAAQNLNQTQAQGQAPATGDAQFVSFGQGGNPYNMFATSGNANQNNLGASDRMAFRDATLAPAPQAQAPPQSQHQQQPQPQSQQRVGTQPTFDWNDLNGDSMNEFLASMSGNNDASGTWDPQPNLSAEDEFTAQLQKLLDHSGATAGMALNSPSTLFGLPPKTLSGNGGAGVDVANDNGFGMGMGMGGGAGGMFNPDDSTDFSQFINAYTGGGGGALGGVGLDAAGAPWSPSNYLNLSPFASSGSASASASESPASLVRDASNSASPESSASPGAATRWASTTVGQVMAQQSSQSPQGQAAPSPGQGQGRATTTVHVPKGCDSSAGLRSAKEVLEAAKRGEIVHVVGEDGKVLKPSDVWVRMGMQHSNNVDSLLIDDLCDQMKSKATCKDGSYQLHVKDAEKMFKFDPRYQAQS